MPDPLEPNDLSHLSDQEFMALCPIGEHAPGPEPLSPAAQAVLDAWDGVLDPEVTCLTRDPEREALAAALRAVAKQSDFADVAVNKTVEVVLVERLLAIAAELEGTPSSSIGQAPFAPTDPQYVQGCIDFDDPLN